jgi:hypothetical protein
VALVLTLCAASRARADETFEIKKADAKGQVGVKGKTSLTIAAKPGWHVNEEAPVTVKLAPDAGVAVEKPRLTRADLAQRTKELARFDVAFTPSEPGRKTINCETSFVMCQETTCKPIKEKVALVVDVAPAKKK